MRLKRANLIIEKNKYSLEILLSLVRKKGWFLKQKERRCKIGTTVSLEFSLCEKLKILFCKNIVVYIDFDTDTNGKYLESYNILRTNRDI